MPIKLCRVHVVIALLLFASLQCHADNNWIAMGTGVAGGTVNAIAVDQGSGSVYVAGSFTSAGGVAGTSRIAKWNGSVWSALGSGINGTATALLLDSSGNLYVAGNFTSAGGVAGTANIAKWDGSNWSALGTGTNGSVNALAQDSAGNVYAGGVFSVVNGVAVANVARWDGSSWFAVGSPPGFELATRGITSMAVDVLNNLYINGIKDSNNHPGFVGRWNGNNWTILPHSKCTGWNQPSGQIGVSSYNTCAADTTSTVQKLYADSAGNIYAGNYFGENYVAAYIYPPYPPYVVVITGTQYFPSLTKWDGTQWHSIRDEGIASTGSTNALYVDYLSSVYVGGFRPLNASFGLFKLTARGWDTFDNSMYGQVNVIAAKNSGQIYIGGLFASINGVTANNIVMLQRVDADSDGYFDTDDAYPANAAAAIDSDGDGYPDYWNEPLAQTLYGCTSTVVACNGLTLDAFPNDPSQFAFPPGTYPTETGFAYAPAGSYAINGVLTPCPPGSYQPDSGASSCIPASAGTYVDTTGSVSYVACPAGDSSYAGTSSSAQCFADSDGDGLPDAIDTNSTGMAKGDTAGVAVVLADMDGDGYADVLIGLPYADRSYVVGSRTFVQKDAGSIRIISGTTGAVIRTLYGSVVKQHFGTAFDVVPDQDGDGIPDIVVGNPLASVFVNHMVLARAGNVSLYSGASGALIRLIANGSTAGEQFGSSVAVGDMNSDMTPDLIVGSPMASVTGATTLSKAGKVTVFTGLTNSVLYIRSGSQAGEHFGAAVAFSSLDKQLLIGSPGYDDVFVSAGKTIKHGDAGQVQIFDATDLTGTSANLFSRVGDNKGDHFGASISSFSQDITGDAQTDWMVGIPGADILNNTTGKTMKDAGKVQLFSGFNSSPVTEITGANAGDNEGSAVSAAGDINKDGVNDLAIGVSKYDISTTVAGKTVLLKDVGRVEVVSGEKL